MKLRVNIGSSTIQTKATSGMMSTSTRSLDRHYALDPYIAVRNVYPTHPTDLLGRIVRITDEDDASIAFSHTALVQRYCPASNSTCLNRRIPCRITVSALSFFVFYVRTATTEACDFFNTTVVIVRRTKREGGNVTTVRYQESSSSQPYSTWLQ